MNSNKTPTKDTVLQHPKYRPDIDGLRAIAVLAVIGFHAFPTWIQGGFVGVDIFFVISGFLISTIIFENLEKNSFSFVEFYSRRIRRIFPALLLVMVSCYALGWFVLFANEFTQLGKHIVGGSAFISNFLFWSESGYFDVSAKAKPLLHLWSLAIEEQFYIVWPLFLWGLWKSRLNALLVTLFIVTISFAYSIWVIKHNPVAAFYSPQSRFWELLAGAVLAYVKLYPERIFPGKKLVFVLPGGSGGVFRELSSLTGAVFLVAGFCLIRRGNTFPGWWALLPTIGAVLLIAAGNQAWINQNILSKRLLVWTGLISYPLYLWHWPLLSFTRIVQGQATSTATRIVIVLLSFILSVLTFRLIERPIRFGRWKRRKTAVLMLAMILVGAAGCGTYLQKGFLWRKVETLNRLKDTGWAGGAEGHLVNKCGITEEEGKKLFARCDSDDRGKAKYALLGDSKAASLYRGLMRTSFEGGRWLVIGGHWKYGSPAPVLSENPVYASHQKLTRIAIDALSRNPDIETVAFMTATRVLFCLRNDHSIEDLPASPMYPMALEGLLNATGKLIRAGKKIVLIVDNPTLPDPKDCLHRRTSSALLDSFMLADENEKCRVVLERHLQLSEQYRKLLREVQASDPENISIFDTTSYLCDTEQGVCLAQKNGRLLYSYGDHISDYAAGLIGEGVNCFLREISDAK